MDFVEPFEQSDEIDAAFGLRGLDNKVAGDEVERAHHSDLLRLARRLDAQVGSPFRPRAGEIGMGQRLRFIGEQQNDVARQRLLFHQLKTQTGSLHGLGVLPAFQRVAGALVGEAPFLRNTTDSRECEMRCPVRRSISSDRRGKVQLIRFSTGAANNSRATASAASAFTGEQPGAGCRSMPAGPSRMNVERQSRTVSSRTPKTSPIAALVQPDSESRIARARSASARFVESANRFRMSRCSALAINGDLPDMIGPPNHLRRLNQQTSALANQRRSA